MKIFIENNGPNVGLILSYFVKRICFFVVFSIFSHHHFRHSSGNTGAFTVLKYIYLWSGSFTEFVGTFPGHFRDISWAAVGCRVKKSVQTSWLHGVPQVHEIVRQWVYKY